MKRVLLIVIGGFLGLCVLCAGLAYFVALPRAQDALEENMEEAISTYVVPYIAGPDVTPAAGTYTLSETDVNREIRTGDPNLEDLAVDITPEFMALRFGQQGQPLTYQAGVAAENGRLAVTNPSMDGVPGWLLSEDTLSGAIEAAINGYLEDTGLVLTGVSLSEGEMTFVTADAS